MTRSYFSLLKLLLISTIILSGCASKPDLVRENRTPIITAEQRTKQLLEKAQWKIKGKIAFIQKTNTKDKRESASITWQVNETEETQELNLTSYLGMNVLHLKSEKNQHLIKVEGKEYTGSNLSQLIFSLTGLTLPTEALSFWLKGLPYKNEDLVQTEDLTQLPKKITSYYRNEIWEIDYSNYKYFDDLQMATKFTIQKDNLLIKVSVNNWSFIN
jgi:outer membrane lipoprotein LolB